MRLPKSTSCKRPLTIYFNYQFIENREVFKYWNIHAMFISKVKSSIFCFKIIIAPSSENRTGVKIRSNFCQKKLRPPLENSEFLKPLEQKFSPAHMVKTTHERINSLSKAEVFQRIGNKKGNNSPLLIIFS